METPKKRSTTKFVLLNILCVVLIVVLGVSLQTSLVLRYTVQESLLPSVAETLPLAEIPVDDATAAQYILDEFIQDERVSAENVQKVMEDGTFSVFLSELTERYNNYLNEGGEFPQLQTEEFIRLIEENEDLIYAETGLEFLEPDKQKLRDTLSPMVEEWNYTAERSMHKGVSGFAVRSAVSLWLPIVLGVLLLAVLVWMIVIYVRSGVPVGKAFKTYGIALFVPSVLLIFAMILMDVLVAVNLPAFGRADNVLQEGNLILCVGILAAAAIFGLGILCNLITSGKAKPETEEEEFHDDFFGVQSRTEESDVTQPEPDSDPDPDAKRRFCRNCGQPLVNPDAKFCYKCGNVQEHANAEE